MLDAHLDQIGMIVTAVLEDGFLKVAGCGGVDRRMLAASQVTVHGRQPLKAVVCSVPPHLQEGTGGKVGKIESFLLDTGLSSEECREKVSPGDRITVDGDFHRLCGELVSSPALDNRAGCAAIIRAAQLLKEEKLSCSLTVALTSLEELSGQGARTAAYQIAPTHAIVVDVSFSDCDGVPRHRTTPLGGGAMVGFSPILSGEMCRGLCETAGRKGLPFTREVMGGRTGTNADEIVTVRGGVRTALLSVPQRNMHTPVEVVSLADIETVASLIAAYVTEQFGEGRAE